MNQSTFPYRLFTSLLVGIIEPSLSVNMKLNSTKIDDQITKEEKLMFDFPPSASYMMPYNKGPLGLCLQSNL